MPAPVNSNQTLIVTHALLIGTTPLIPVPFVDDLAKSFFQRRLFRQLALARGQTFSPKVVSILAEDRGGCLSGCLSMVFLYPIKKVFRKVVFILEWQRAVNLVTQSYYHGYLLNIALSEGWLKPDDQEAATRVRTAIDRAYRGANTHLVKETVRRTFLKSRNLFKDVARRISGRFRAKDAKDAAQNVDQILEQEEPQAEASI
ncbi:MAG TPA: hypothetical protein VNO14_13575, partial [Blastocatellia bacterium]|nr:hypothetical protein [Blastocatellia bacterium]